MYNILDILKKEKVMTISLILAAISVFFVHPDSQYSKYIDWRVLSILFCLMIIIKGFQNIGLFDIVIHKVFGKINNARWLCILLIWLCFFFSMFITNDVALITFVPFSIAILKYCNIEKYMIKVIVMQTIAANLGSMGTPIGNPQNLYLYAVSNMNTAQFLRIMIPLVICSFAIITITAFIIFSKEKINVNVNKHAESIKCGEFIVYIILFIINILVVLRVIQWQAALIITVVGIIVVRKPVLFKKVDYALLVTFAGFFIFVGNIGRVELVNNIINRLIDGREIIVSALLSQVISNVPTAILLSGFTEDYAGLLVGTNIGGLGTLIASMASLISYKLYAAQKDSDTGMYIKIFTLYNVAGLIILLLFEALLRLI